MQYSVKPETGKTSTVAALPYVKSRENDRRHSMKTVDVGTATLDGCVNDAQADRVIVTRGGKPVALVLGVEGMDVEQLQLGTSDKFWMLISERRRQQTINRAKLEQLVSKKKRSR